MGKLLAKINPVKVIENSDLFDAAWYEKEYGIPRKSAARHYYEEGYKQGCDPSEHFSGSNYLACNPDIGEMNPLYHYETWGRKEKRILQTDAMQLPSQPPPQQVPLYANRYVYDSDFGKNIKSCAIMACYSQDETIPEYVTYYIKELKKCVDAVILISDNYLKDVTQFNEVRRYVSYAEFMRRGTYDFGSYKRGLEILKEKEMLSQLEELYLVNDSCYGPIEGFQNVIEQMRKKECDFWGLLDCPDRNRYHLLSFFYCFKQPIISDPMFRNFFTRVKENMTWDYVVMNLELELTEYLLTKYKAESYIKDFCKNDLQVVSGNRNATLWPMQIIKQGFPLVKVKTLDGRYGLDMHDNPNDVIGYIKEKNTELYGIIQKDLLTRKRRNSFIEDPDIFARLEEKDLISFDVFDTLLIRPFAFPTDLFDYIEQKYKIENFSRERKLAEDRARKVDEDNPEVLIDDIYAQMPPQYMKVKAIELKEEFDKIEPNIKIRYLYNYAVKYKKKIIATTDMYLPEKAIRKMLDKCGFEKIEKIYVSGEYRKSKATGKLFRQVLIDNASDGKNIIHIGDNNDSDVRRPREFDMDSMKIHKNYDVFMNSPANIKYLNYWIENSNLQKSIHLSLLTERFIKTKGESTFFEELGYYVGGPLALSYLHFICEQAKKNGIDRFLFAARDGYLLKEMYEKYFYKKYRIESSYAYLSRAVILSSTLNYQKDPVYLRTILLMAKDHIHNIFVYKNDEDNKEEYSKHREEIEKWAAKNFENLKRHLEDAAKDSESLAVVDMTTGRFTSLTGAHDVLGERVKMGFFTGAFTNDCKLPYETFMNDDLEYTGYDIEKVLSLSEVLITSPEDGIVGIDRSGHPVYEEREKGRGHRYDQVVRGIDQYIQDFMARFEVEDCTLISMKDWMELSGNYLKWKYPIDEEGLDAIKFRTQPLDKQKEIKFNES